ncbi:hypothetical protein Tco_1554911 [Tanacetum coccineum]
MISISLFRSFFGEEHQTFKLKMFHNLDQLRLQLERENLHGVNAKTCLQALRTQFKEFLASKGVNATDLLNQGWQQDFERGLYALLELVLLSQDVQINPVQAVDDRLIVSKSSGIESKNNNALSKSVNETQLQQHENAAGQSLDKHDTSIVPADFYTLAVVRYRPVNVQVPFAEGDSNTTSDSTNMCHRGGEIDQDAELYQAKSPLLKAGFLKTNDMVEKEVYNELSNRFLQIGKTLHFP